TSGGKFPAKRRDPLLKSRNGQCLGKLPFKGSRQFDLPAMEAGPVRGAECGFVVGVDAAAGHSGLQEGSDGFSATLQLDARTDGGEGEGGETAGEQDVAHRLHFSAEKG